MPACAIGMIGLRDMDRNRQGHPVGEGGDSPVAVDESGAVQRRRFIGVHFTHWLVDLESVLMRRALFHLGVHEWSHPLVVVAEQGRVHRVIGSCELAMAAGVRVGMTISQAESVCPATVDAGRGESALGRACVERLRSGSTAVARALGGRNWAERIVSNSERMAAVRHDPVISMRALERIARCLERWIPEVSLVDGEHDGVLAGDFTGCSELFRGKHGTEQRLMRRIAASLGKRGFRTQVATASTVGTAIAVARWMDPTLTRRKRGCVGVACGAEREFIAPLPIEALRITPGTVEAMRSVEVRTIGDAIRLQETARGRQGIAERLSGVTHPEGGDGVAASSRRTAPARGPSRSRHVASTGAWRETPSLFALSAADSPECTLRPRARQAAAPARHVKSVDDLLLRLDQALGIEPESIVPMRFRDPVVFERIFDAPCSRIEAIFVACGELIDRLVATLAARREGLRAATWTFRHAELPVEPPTGASAPTSAPTSTPTSKAAPPRVSRIDLGLSRPSVSRSHMWVVLRSRLERLALDHGVESIECRVERTARLRVGQLRLLSVGDAPQASSASRASAALQPSSARGEWLDQVGARLGLSSVRALRDAGGLSEHDSDTHRPHALFGRPEPAQIGADAQAACLAHALATRTVWSSHGADAWFAWRDSRWPLLAIDGWERDAHHWWRSDTQSCARTGVHGRVHSRVQVANGLWLFVRWPTHLARIARNDHARNDHAHPNAGWMAGSAAALAAGVELEVLGAWG